MSASSAMNAAFSAASAGAAARERREAKAAAKAAAEDKLTTDVVNAAMAKPARGGGYENTPEQNTGNMIVGENGREAVSFTTPVNGFVRGNGAA